MLALRCAILPIGVLFRFVPGPQFEFQQTFILGTDVLRANWMGYLCWVPNVTDEKNAKNTFAPAGD